MMGYGRQLRGGMLTRELQDVTGKPLPHAAGSVDLVSMSWVLHVFDEPLPILEEIRRVLAPGGIFLLHDWIRQPLAAYLAWRRDVLGERETEHARRGYRLFPVHNKYTTEDWRWLLAQAGLTIRHPHHLTASH